MSTVCIFRKSVIKELFLTYTPSSSLAFKNSNQENFSHTVTVFIPVVLVVQTPVLFTSVETCITYGFRVSTCNNR